MFVNKSRGGAFCHFHATKTLLWIQATFIDSFDDMLYGCPGAAPGGGKGGDVPPLAFKEGEGGGRGEGRFWARRAKKYEK